MSTLDPSREPSAIVARLMTYATDTTSPKRVQARDLPRASIVSYLGSLIDAADDIAAQRLVPSRHWDVEQDLIDAARGHPRLIPSAWSMMHTAILNAGIAEDWRGRWPWLAVIAALRHLVVQDMQVLLLEAAMHPYGEGEA